MKNYYFLNFRDIEKRIEFKKFGPMYAKRQNKNQNNDSLWIESVISFVTSHSLHDINKISKNNLAF